MKGRGDRQLIHNNRKFTAVYQYMQYIQLATLQHIFRSVWNEVPGSTRSENSVKRRAFLLVRVLHLVVC